MTNEQERNNYFSKVERMESEMATIFGDKIIHKDFLRLEKAMKQWCEGMRELIVKAYPPREKETKEVDPN